MERIKQFGNISGYRVNWNKSILIPLDQLKNPIPGELKELRIVPNFKYLVIIIAPDVLEYNTLNLTLPVPVPTLRGGW